MRRILRSPATNAAGIGIFTAFYAWIFLGRGAMLTPGPRPGGGFWASWSGFLASGGSAVIAWALIAVAVLTVAMLLTRRRPYDEYHTAHLVQCLAVAAVLTLACIAAFFWMILVDPAAVVEKFALFIAVHWATVALADLAYVVACRWK